ncbi:hypothetical protein BT63DRAFT_437011 [Microthyrium microscopicum]|uniref:Life-span regulatory factor domain-containing protein n=1 Tax=Microthyrium microscopicum TaxID=703497 RepID=A0A6A6UP90_9PEZI|nr:hypothetical protein BT63DRAFT_437011 [Microthyrium microscopicum]
MSTEMEWSPNYCLNCDKQTPEPHYCSQACRLADLEKSAFSAPVSPGYGYSASSNSSTLSFSVSKSSKQFHLPPAFNFAAYRHGSSSRIESPPLSPRAGATLHHHSHSATQHNSSHRPAPLYRATTDYSQRRSLNPSTSRSSLSSISSSSTSGGLSDHALSQLQNYSNSFDHSRDWKRRTTLG